VVAKAQLARASSSNLTQHERLCRVEAGVTESLYVIRTTDWIDTSRSIGDAAADMRTAPDAQ
jgi:hypothetical protein